MNNKDALKGQRFTASDGNEYIMLHTGRIARIEIDDAGEEEQVDVSPFEQIKLRQEFKTLSEKQ